MADRSLVLLRHGRTDWNVVHRIQGQQESQLDEVGHAEGRAAAAALANLSPAVLWSSDLARAQATAAYVGQACGLEPVLDERLREYALGQREGLLHTEYADAAPDEHARFRAGDFDVVPGGESTEAVAKRMAAALDDLLAAVPDGAVGVAVTHGAAARVAVAAVLGWDLGAARDVAALRNGAWLVLGESPATGRMRLTAYNLMPGGQPPDFRASSVGG